MPLLTDIQNIIAAGLMRKSVTTCARWSEQYRIMGTPIPGPFGFKYHPWLREMHDTLAWKNVGMKSAQMGFTEWALNRTFYAIDIKRIDCLYVLPNKTPDASDFSSARFDAALELSPHLTNLFSDVKNVGHKRAGSNNLYVRGSRSRGGMKSIPVGHMTLDEFDEMDHAQVVLAIERMSGQFYKELDMLSTPTMPNEGIHKEYLESTQENFVFQCPHCSRWTELIFPDCFVCTADAVTDIKIHNSYVQCKECKHSIQHELKYETLADAKWRPTVDADPSVRGFYINQLYSSTVKPAEFGRSYLLSLLDPTDEQEFHNSKCGIPHIVKGAKVSEEDYKACIGPYTQTFSAKPGTIITMGVDVGSYLHVEIDEWDVTLGPDVNTNSRPRVIHLAKLRNFEELDALMREFQVLAAVVDMFPEKRKAKEFADRFYGSVKLCYYGRGQATKSLRFSESDADHQVTVDRTSWLDLALSRFMKQTITVPRNAPAEYSANIRALVRVYTRDKDGNSVGRYSNQGADHFGHARNYAEIALPFAVSTATGQDVEGFL